jgi:hypothetical protein
MIQSRSLCSLMWQILTLAFLTCLEHFCKWTHSPPMIVCLFISLAISWIYPEGPRQESVFEILFIGTSQAVIEHSETLTFSHIFLLTYFILQSFYANIPLLSRQLLLFAWMPPVIECAIYFLRMLLKLCQGNEASYEQIEVAINMV